MDDEALIAESASHILAQEFGRGALHRWYDGDDAVADRLVELSVEMGWMIASVAEAAGGLGLSPRATLAVLRECGRVAAPDRLMSAGVAGLWSRSLGDDPFATTIGAGLADGSLAPALPGLDRNGSIVLEGGGASGTFAGLFGAKIARRAIVPARRDGGQVMVLIDLTASGATMRLRETWDRTRSVGTLECARAPVIAEIADADGRLYDALLAALRLALAADGIGGMASVRDATVTYLGERHQFGRAIGSFQAIKHRVADRHLDEVALRGLYDLAVEHYNGDTADAFALATLAKAEAGAAYRLWSDESVLLHGGVGFTWEFDCHIFQKRARLNEVLGGSPASDRDEAFSAVAGLVAANAPLAEMAA